MTEEGTRRSHELFCPSDFNLGKLQEFPITKILEAENKELARLIVTLCLIYNDFKDLFLLDGHLEQRAKSIDKDDSLRAKAQSGQISGMREHIRRILIAGMLELLQTLSENREVIDSGDFRRLVKMVKKIHTDFDDDWGPLMALALETCKPGAGHAFTNALVKIRNNGAYHYKQTKSLFDGLEDYCKTREDRGYVSEGNTLEKTRFYFADAAIQCYHQRVVGKGEYRGDFPSDLDKYIKKVNNVLYFVTLVYLTGFLRVDLKTIQI